MDNESLFEMSADYLEDVEPIKEVFDLSGKVAVVSGSVGLALFVVNRLLECGAKVVFGSRTQEWGDMAIEALSELGYEDVAFKRYDARMPKAGLSSAPPFSAREPAKAARIAWLVTARRRSVGVSR